MFCPKCRCEYREGFTKCSDCDVPLVSSLPAEEKPQKTRMGYTDFECIMESFIFTDIALIKSIFEGEGIRYYIQGEDIGVAPGGMPARVLVSREQAEEAKALLKESGLL